MTFETCLPDHLRGPTTTITRIAAGLSGAGVYRVDAGGHAYVLKVGADTDPASTWHRRLAILQLASEAGLAPRVIHTDAARRAIVSELVVDRSFPARFADPRTRDAALVQLGQTIRRVHALPLPAGATWQDPRDMVTPIWATLGDFALPAFVRDTISGVLAEAPPARERPLVTSHNDLNPSNLVFDGERLMFLDWDAAGPNDPWYDLAAIAVFLRMDDASAAAMIAAYDGTAPGALPVRFLYSRRLIAALCATMFLALARGAGHAGGDVRVEDAPSLADVYQRMRAGTLGLASADGRWAFALALVRAAAGR